MTNIKGKLTGLEHVGWKALKDAGMSFRKHPNGIFGRPDAANKSKKIAVFFDSEFWHGYKWETRKRNIKSNRAFWFAKIERNIARDRHVTRKLRRQGWKVIRLWSKDLSSKRIQATIRRLQKKLLD